MPATRGIRNNNPGNIRHSTTAWQGQSKTQDDPAFVTFTSAQFGVRALAKTLLTYFNAYGLRTVTAIISRWAPPNENNTAAYIAAVADGVGAGPDATLNVDSVGVMLPLVKAIIQHENQQPGVSWVQPYSDTVLMDALRMAGVSDAKPKPLINSKQFVAGVGSVAGSGLTFVAAAQPTIQQVHDAVAPYSESPHVAHLLPILAGVGAALAVATVVFQLIHRKATGA